MNKKIIIIALFIHFINEANAQFFRGVGIFVGPTTSSHRYKNLNLIDNQTFAHALPAPSHRSAEFPYFSIGILGEFLKYDHIRWQTEFEYASKGGIERQTIAPGTGQRYGPSPNVFQYIQWNNFIKMFGNEGYRGVPYLMLGARIEYCFARAVTAYGAVAGAVPPINFSPDAGIGYEFASRSKWHLFTEFHYNPDALKMVVSNVVFWQRMFELRIGVIYRPKRRPIDDCNAPRYRGANY
jgi:hypothetical protein